jgi:hypothetical protein
MSTYLTIGTPYGNFSGDLEQAGRFVLVLRMLEWEVPKNHPYMSRRDGDCQIVHIPIKTEDKRIAPHLLKM